MPENCNKTGGQKSIDRLPAFSLGLAVIGLFFFFEPLLTLYLCVFALILAVASLRSTRKATVITSFVLSVIGLAWFGLCFAIMNERDNEGNRQNQNNLKFETGETETDPPATEINLND